MKYKILKFLDISKKANSKISIDRIEKLINLGSKERLIGGELIILLQTMIDEDLIISDENNWFYSISQNGVDYLNKKPK